MIMVDKSEALIDSLKVTAPAKINLHLEVLGLRTDGFHELAMVMQTIDLFDYLEIKSTKDGSLSLSTDNEGLSTASDNLIVKAANLLRNRSGLKNLGASIHLEKRIPIGAGLAGGSSDGAATLVGLNNLWSLGFSKKELVGFAAELGSDMPFCVEGGIQLCFGRGECLEPLDGNDSSLAVLVVKDPMISISTPWAYGLSKKLNGSKYLETESEFEERRKELREETWLRPLSIQNPPPLRNDLQNIVASVTPAVDEALKILSKMPKALSFAMSGSGPSCFALFPDLASARESLEDNRIILQSAGLESWCCNLRSQGVTLEP